MANTIAPFGFRTFGHRDGMAPTMGLERRFITSSDTNTYFTGDVVQQSSGIVGFISSGTNSGAPVAGIFAGCEFFNTNVQKQVWSPFFPGAVGATATVGPTIAYIISDPEMTFIAQASSGTVVGTSMIGMGVGFTLTSSNGNTTTGISAVAIASSLVGAGSSQAFKVVDVYSNFAPPGVNGTDNTTSGAILVVAPNNWDRKSLVGVSS